MNVFSSIRSRIALVVLALVSTLFGLASAGSPASANWDGIIGKPGSYGVNPTLKTNQPTMIGAFTYGTTQMFTTNGVSVDMSTASTQPQTVVARYRLEYQVPDSIMWAPMEEFRVSQDIPGYVPLAHRPGVDLGGHLFLIPKMQPKGTLYRVMYTVEWYDTATGKKIGYRDVYPDANNNSCANSVTTCTVSAAGTTW
jgi:hypothetical protein